MLLLTGILPKLKSDPVGDTREFTSAQVAASGGHTHTSGPDLGPGLPRDLPRQPVPLLPPPLPHPSALLPRPLQAWIGDPLSFPELAPSWVIQARSPQRWVREGR